MSPENQTQPTEPAKDSADADSDSSTSDSVNLVVDANRCIGAGQCEMLAPDHFRVDDDSALAEFIGQDSLPATEAELLIDRCPSGALSITPQR